MLISDGRELPSVMISQLIFVEGRESLWVIRCIENNYVPTILVILVGKLGNCPMAVQLNGFDQSL